MAFRNVLCFLALVALVVMAFAQQEGGAQNAATAATSPPASTKAPLPRLPRSYWEWKGKAGEYPSYSIIIPSHNTAPYVTATLQSVADSIKYFNNHGGNKVMSTDASCHSRMGSLLTSSRQFRAEVVVVDDASTDNTVARVMAFMEQQKRLNISSTT